MYTVEEIKKPTGRDAVVVRRNHRMVGAASVPFIRWMHAHVPAKQLSPEQVALVSWFEKHKQH
ncbi:MAG: hypothetical protein PVH91_08565 [Pseudomonadales bacterium]|jgi:hypothetical protein